MAQNQDVNLEPVDYDPFANNDLEPVEGNPFAASGDKTQVKEEPNIIDRFKKDMVNRSNNIADIQRQYDTGKINVGSGLLQTAGQVAGATLVDPMAEAVHTLTPDWYVNAANKAMANNGVMNAGNEKLADVQEKWANVKQAHPELAGDVEALGTIIGSGAVPPIARFAAKEVGPAVGALAKGSVTLPVKGAVAAGKGIGEGFDTLKEGWTARNPGQIDNLIANTRQSGGQFYQAMKANGAVISPQATTKIIGNIENAIKQNGIVTPVTHPKTVSALDYLKNPPAGAPAFSLESLDLYRRTLNDIIDGDRDIKGHIHMDGQAAITAKNALDDAVKNISRGDLISGDMKAINALNKGRFQWQQASKLDDINRILKKADGNPDKIKLGFANFMDKEKNWKGKYTPQEITLMKAAAGMTNMDKVMKMIGKTGIDTGNVKNYGNLFIPLMELVAGHESGHPYASGVAIAAGTVAKGMRRLKAKGQAERVIKAIESRPLPSMPQAAAQPSTGAVSANVIKRKKTTTP